MLCLHPTVVTVVCLIVRRDAENVVLIKKLVQNYEKKLYLNDDVICMQFFCKTVIFSYFKVL